jgi:hypothetical protein
LDAVIKPFVGSLPDGTPRIVAGDGAIYVRDGSDEAVAAIATALQHTPRVGAIFTRPERPASLDGMVPGTLSLDAVRWNHARSAAILFSPDWTDEPNQYGFRGSTASDGVAGHGSSSPFEIHNTLIAAGQDLKQGITVDVPSGNVDFAPTFLYLLGVAAPPSMHGRVLEEALRTAPEPSSIRVATTDHRVESADGSYVLTATISTVDTSRGRYRYFDRTSVERR